MVTDVQSAASEKEKTGIENCTRERKEETIEREKYKKETRK